MRSFVLSMVARMEIRLSGVSLLALVQGAGISPDLAFLPLAFQHLVLGSAVEGFQTAEQWIIWIPLPHWCLGKCKSSPVKAN